MGMPTKEPLRVLFCRSNPISPDPRVEKEGRALRRAGYQVRVLGWDRSGQLPEEEVNGELTISRLPIRAGFGKGMMNLPQLLRWQAGLMGWLTRHHREFDAIHACDFDTIIPAVLCKILYKKKLVYDIFDFYADHLRATPGIVKEVIRAVDLSLINRVDALILVDDSRRKQVSKAHPSRLSVIYNSPEDLQESYDHGFSPSNSGRLSIAYIGLLQVERGLLELLDVLSRHPNWKLDMAGFGGDQERILALARSLPNVTWHGRVPYERAIEISRAADLLIATYDPAIPNHRYSSPNKVFEAMLLGKPIVVARDTNMDLIIEQVGCGVVVPYGNVEALEKALDRLCASPELRLELGRKARQAYDSQYSWKIMESRLLELYRDIFSDPWPASS